MDGVLVQCVSFVCRSLLAFLLSVCTYVCVVYGFNLYVSGCVLPRKSKPVRSTPDQTATFPETSLVHLLAVVVGVLLA